MVLSSYTQPIHRGATRRASALLRLAVVIAVHAAVLLALMQHIPTVREQLVPVFVSLITPPQPPAPAPTAASPAPPPSLQKRQISASPKPAAASPKVPVTREPAPAAISAEPATASAPTASVAAPATTAASASTVSASAPVAAVSPAPAVIPPRFDAAYLNNPRPEYPRLARRMGEHGKVMLRVFVSSAGVPERVEIRSSSGSPRLDQAARDAVEQWRFVPARQGEEPVAAWVLVPITFVLEG